jgi:hypothetical protein
VSEAQLTGHKENPEYGIVLHPGEELVLQPLHFPLLLTFKDRRYVIRISRYGGGLFMTGR